MDGRPRETVRVPADHGVGRAATGDPPLVTVASYDKNANETDLIPRSAQGVQWLIASISYDTNPIRNTRMRRIRQAATVSLIEFVSAPDFTFDSPATRAKGRHSKYAGFDTYYSTAALYTVKLIVERHSNLSDGAVMREVLKFNREHGLSYVSATKKLKVGSKVLIPRNITD